MLIEAEGEFHIVSRITYYDKPHHEDFYLCFAEIGSVAGRGIDIELRDWDAFFDLVKKTDVVMQKAKAHYDVLRIKEEESMKDTRL